MTQRDNYSLLGEVKYRNKMKCKQTTTSTIDVLRKQVFSYYRVDLYLYHK